MSCEEAKLAASLVYEAAIESDDEVAHGREDDLRRAVLREIVNNPALTLEQIRQLAAVALCTECLDFARWCA